MLTLTILSLFTAGNEYFRSLVRKHKVAYVACPKPQKARFSRLIVDEIYARNGRFLKQDPNTKLWHDIGDKKALDKTRQALREGAPELRKELHPLQQEVRVGESCYARVFIYVYKLVHIECSMVIMTRATYWSVSNFRE